MKAKTFKRLLNLWPPFLGMGVKVRHISEDFRFVRVEAPLRWYNRNYVKTHFGGTLFAMTDPFPMVMLMQFMADRYMVWDQKASIEFRRPGRGTVAAEISITDEFLAEVEATCKDGSKHLIPVSIPVKDENGDTVAVVEKTVYFRLKSKRR